ncbi:MAG: cobaltochelatase subunit CobN, partial [Rhodomicrobium sp.]
YGAEELAHACRKRGVTLAVLPGDGRDDPRLRALSTFDGSQLDMLEAMVRAGGSPNAARAIAALLAEASGKPIDLVFPSIEDLPEFGVYREVKGTGGGSLAIVFYRSFLLAADTDPIDVLFEALADVNAACPDIRVYYIPSLKAPGAADWLRQELQRQAPDVIINTTAFSAHGGDGGSPLDVADCAVIQAAMASCTKDAWEGSSRGLLSADLAMHVVLPELDGRLFGGAISFKDRDASGAVFHRPHPEGIEHIAALASAWMRLRRKAPRDRKLALVLSSYPRRPDQIAHAVGLDGPESALRIAQRLIEAGYSITDLPSTPRMLLESLRDKSPLTLSLSPAWRGDAGANAETNSEGTTRAVVWSLAEYKETFSQLPEPFREAVASNWGTPEDDPAFATGSIALPITSLGSLFVCLQPERGFLTDRKSGYHDPNLPPRHGYIAFYLWLGKKAGIDALIHLGAHGTLEWLPGKAVALSQTCAPRALLGPLPVIYPFIVNNPGEAAQAKRRISAVTIGHNTPPLSVTEPSPGLKEIERLLDEYSAADGLDNKRRDRLAQDVLNAVAKSGMQEVCGIAPNMTEAEALMRVDAFLCDVKALAISDGLHILDDTELNAIVRALDGRLIEPGPSGAPSRGRSDVLPAGRNLYTVDTRAIPTPLACENGARMAGAILARYVEDHGDWPRSMVLDLWGSQTMRTGGEELGTALALLGVKPVWDHQSFRVTGFEIIPLMKLNRPRIDVTLRISGLLRDMFPAQLSFFHAAVRRVAALDEPAESNPLCRRKGELYRIFGADNGAYGTSIAQRINTGEWTASSDLGETYLAASGTAYTGDGEGFPAHRHFERQVRLADGFVHIQDHRETDILSHLDFAAHEGGFAAAASALGNKQARVYHADASVPETPRVRTLQEEASRVLHGRALSGRWLQGQMRHGFAGAGQIATTVDSAFAFAATSGAISSDDLEHLYEAYLGDPSVASFIARENGAALEAIQKRFKEAIARSLWKPRRNDLSALEGEPAL